MKTYLQKVIFTPIFWGFLLSSVGFAKTAAPYLKPNPLPFNGSNVMRTPDLEIHSRVLAIRVQFQLDTLATTTGNGRFNSGFPSDMIVDPLPHDRAYFEDHLLFLKNYFATVSQGKVTLDTFAVYPQQDTAAYLLPHQMWHYNHNTTQADLNTRLAQLFVDAWQTAGQDTSLHPENYDTFIIYHAGVGQDFQIGYDETPHDIPSAYFNLEDLREALNDSTFLGVQIGSVYVNSGLLLPESEHQSEVDVEIALNGTEALLFAHYLGLPSLYDTETGASRVGRFSLMDQGSGNFAGLIPCHPDAWSRAFMGWQTPYSISPDDTTRTYQVCAFGKADPTDSTQREIYRIDLNESEYLLIENRNADPDTLEYTYAYDAQGRRLKIRSNYEIEVMDGDFGVIVRVGNYDFGIPGGGILIWRIDERVINEKYAENSINNDLSHRGVELLEADGAPDLGQEYGFLNIGYGTELGWRDDFFYGTNSSFQAMNNSSNVTLHDDTHPSTRSHDRSPTGLRLGGFTPKPDTVMSFWVTNVWAQTGFPALLAERSEAFSPCPLDFDDDEITDWIITFTPGGSVQAFDSAGRAQGQVIRTSFRTTLLGETMPTSDMLLIELDSLTFDPALAILEDATYPRSFFAVAPSQAGKVYRIQHRSGLPGVDSTTADSVQLDADASAMPLIVSDGSTLRWYVGDVSGFLYAFNNASAPTWKTKPFAAEAVIGYCLTDTLPDAPLFMLTSQGGAALINPTSDAVWTKRLPFAPAYPPIAAYQIKYSRWDLVAVGSGGEIALLNPTDGSYREGFPVNVGTMITAPPTAADLDRDGRLEIILLGANRLLAVQTNGYLLANLPATLNNNRPTLPITSPPAIAELTLSSEAYVLFGWGDGSLEARNRWGAAPGYFPHATGNAIRSAPLLLQFDADSSAEIVALTESGALCCWELSGSAEFNDLRLPWNGLQNGNLRQGLALDPVLLAPTDPTLLVKSKVYAWPNPASEISHLRYLMGKTGRISVRIFDGAGDLIKELTGWSEAGIEGELEWNLAEVTSGVYLARVEAESGGETERTFIKIAVVK